ncbi:MAG: GNAT family N-acetyltransferase [Pyrinomonadaceae bacterium]|nr:GNAT family N-acetyltransferase [Pyrinomonadaceae bacterium]MCX7640946.1 GNAT family N-acetyltransferase [Pyrinomonadaceae bacterium]MDW8304728.1 GNAT family N-acetyltransferase [Acidobacteriota bacterium]
MAQVRFKVRAVERKDFQSWLELRKNLWDELTDEEHKEEMLQIYHNPETQLVLIAELETEEVVGFLEASIRPFAEDCLTDNVGYLEGWYVKPEYRRHGIGRALVETAERWAKNMGCEEMASDSEIGNELSITVHAKLGYEETSRLVHWRKEL